MPSYLIDQIQTRMAAKRLSIYALEKKAGLKRSAVRNILHGLSKKPSVETIKCIAIALECSVDELVGPDLNNGHLVISHNANGVKKQLGHEWNEKLYIEAAQIVAKNLQEHEYKPTFEQALLLISETYKYSLSKRSNLIDDDFTKWLLRKNI
jgi:transcriptional regulator with XRE-family HTH domain